MGRKSKEVMDIEAQRLNIIHTQRKELVKALKKPPNVKKSGFLPGEELKQKNLAIFLKIAQPRVSYTQIAAQLGETKSTVKGWFADDPYMREQYEWLLHNLSEGALDYIRTYTMEAVATLVSLMRWGSEKYMLEAAKEILDRGGLSKISKQEVATTKTETHSWDNSLVERIRELPEDKQEEAAALIEGVEKFLSDTENNSNSDDDETKVKTEDDEDWEADDA